MATVNLKFNIHSTELIDIFLDEHPYFEWRGTDADLRTINTGFSLVVAKDLQYTYPHLSVVVATDYIPDSKDDPLLIVEGLDYDGKDITVRFPEILSTIVFHLEEGNWNFSELMELGKQQQEITRHDSNLP